MSIHPSGCHGVSGIIAPLHPESKQHEAQKAHPKTVSG